MPRPLPFVHPARRLSAGLALGLALALTSGPVFAAEVETVTLDNTAPLQLAHHGGEGVGTAGLLGTQAAAAATDTLQGGVTFKYVNNSLFGNWLLGMAYQRDPELRRLAKHLGFANALTMLSIVGVTGLGLAQSIYTYRDALPQSIDVTEAHGPGGHDHVHIPPESRVPSVMGMVGSGVTLAALGTRAVVNAHYQRKIKNRQIVISQQIDQLIERLSVDNNERDAIQTELEALVGEQASREFIALWQMVHFCPAVKTPLSNESLPELPE